MADEVDRRLDAAVNEAFDEYFEDTYNIIVENRTDKKKKRAYVEQNREAGHNRLWNDYFSENPSFSKNLFRRRFRMNKQVFMRIIDTLSANVPFFQQRRDAVGRLGLSTLQKCTAAIRMLAYGCVADAVDEYLRLGESIALSCLTHFTDAVILLFGEEYLRRPIPEDLQRLLDIGEIRGFPGMIGSIDCTLNDINVLDRSPVFDDIYQGRAPRVTYMVNGHQYDLAYYLTDGGYTLYDTSEFEEGDSSRSSHVEHINNMPTHFGNMLGLRNHVRDRHTQEALKNDLIENIWNKFGDDEDA
ncbi:PREDICTED: uncharacterized protein LOC106303227 [Brassica oleracea var. oleracea]|uniref:uncharacterized protein LOC106303227 n=1 Tax=Brassica oleracea var. oleracea TaxID=109376 RepID=UPI0006A6EAF2|nr:PREDICTED: uncharacterized protein LOC106303227 [Brassica oleracea var. oleracea]